jgi:hypothetical protein
MLTLCQADAAAILQHLEKLEADDALTIPLERVLYEIRGYFNQPDTPWLIEQLAMA